MQRPGLNKLWGVVALFALFGAAPRASMGQVFTHNAETPILDTPTLVDQLAVAGGPAVITDINVVLDIDHPDLSQLDILLIPPDGQHYLVLSADTPSTAGGFVRTRFDDDACFPIYDGSGRFTGSFKPEGGLVIPYQGTAPLPAWWMDNLAVLNGQNANGTWRLLIDDDTNGATGILHWWSLEFNGAINPNGPADLNRLCATAECAPPVSRHGDVVTVRVSVVPRSNPPSTNIAAFASDASIGVPSFTLHDDGNSNDGPPGDNVFGGSFMIPAGAPLGHTDVSFVVQDAQSRFGIGTALLDIAPDTAWFELEDGGADAGGMPATAQVVTALGRTELRGYLGNPDDVDMFEIAICDPAAFRASTVGVTSYDTQLFLFDKQGYGVVMNDDAFASYQSTITNQFVVQPGEYYLAISRYDRDPIDAGFSEIWDDSNYIFEQRPDGLGASNPIAGWYGLTYNPVGPYVISLLGVLPAGSCPQSVCDNVDFNGDNLFPDTLDIDDFLSVFGGGPCSNGSGCHDIDFNNDSLFPDVADFEAFLRVFSGGSCAP